ncbi:MAG: hypothetical protein NUV91_01150 [Candidatus Omnitrophica bacterium]|nr:hypothetical protein [Candidatus Omnitrophota bacterium]
MKCTRYYSLLVFVSMIMFLNLSFGGSLAQGNGVKITQVSIQGPLSEGQSLVRGSYQVENEEPGMRVAANVFINNSLTGSTVVNGGRFEINLPGGRKLAAGEQVHIQLSAGGSASQVSEKIIVQALR